MQLTRLVPASIAGQQLRSSTPSTLYPQDLSCRVVLTVPLMLSTKFLVIVIFW